MRKATRKISTVTELVFTLFLFFLFVCFVRSQSYMEMSEEGRIRRLTVSSLTDEGGIADIAEALADMEAEEEAARADSAR